MLNLNEKVMYGTTGVCTVERIEEKKIGKVVKRYYVLKPVLQGTSTVYIPEDNDVLIAKARKMLSKNDVKDILKCLQNEKTLWVDDDNERKAVFCEIICSGDRLRCLSLIKTLLEHQKMLAEKGKRLHIADERALREAQRLIHDEFAVVLNITFDEAVALVKNEIKSCLKV